MANDILVNLAADHVRALYDFGADERPLSMAAKVFRDPERLQELSPHHLQEVVSWWIADAIVRAAEPSGADRTLSGKQLLAEWDSLPDEARALFPESVGMRIEQLAEDGEATFSSLPQGMRFLRGDESVPKKPTHVEMRERARRNRDLGILENGRLRRWPATDEPE